MSQISIVHAVLSLYANITVNGDQKAIKQIVSSSFRVAKAASQSISDGPSRSSRALLKTDFEITRVKPETNFRIQGFLSIDSFSQYDTNLGLRTSTTLKFVPILACCSWLQISWQRISQIEHRVYRKKVGPLTPLLLVMYSIECTQVWSSARWLAFVTNAKGNCGRLQQDGSITRPFLNPTKPADN